jgi:RNA polymerase sigma-70 factor (ECF subfamily)
MQDPTLAAATMLELVRRAKAGDFAAFEQIVCQLQPRVYGLALRILRQAQDAEDVTQQTFLSLVEHIEDFREESSLATWVLKIATHHALKVLRKRRGLSATSMSEFPGTDSYHDVPHPEFIAPWSQTAEEIAEQAEVQAELDRALADLDDKYRLVFILRDIEQLSVRETADTLGLKESTVKVRLLRARLALRERLTRKFGDASQILTPDHKHG